MSADDTNTNGASVFLASRCTSANVLATEMAVSRFMRSYVSCASLSFGDASRLPRLTRPQPLASPCSTPAKLPSTPLYCDSSRIPTECTAAVHGASRSRNDDGFSASAACHSTLCVHSGVWPLGVRNGRPLELVGQHAVQRATTYLMLTTSQPRETASLHTEEPVKSATAHSARHTHRQTRCHRRQIASVPRS